ncbi:MAG: hypothetical protein PHX87_03960 [Candidatus Peribacteraceae bacterium]|nr:hypothetical protein [Candidatus Peribacteraceae bacterium]MDD5742559.1 hypothetical protein [Candidatus Peribacteraceae bacterium]
MKKYMFGTIVGISSLILIPILATAASSASGESKTPRQRPVPSQACLQAQVAEQDLMLSTFDATFDARKVAMQAHRDALAAAASISDETQRQAALQQANEDFRTAMKAMMPEDSTQMQTAREAVRDACGGPNGLKGEMGFGIGGGFGGGRMMGGFRGEGMHRGQGKGPPSQESSTDEE